LPFEPLVPNIESVAAIKSARCSKLETANSVKNLIEDLNADDQIHQPVQAGLAERKIGQKW
jgi:hypothetical protein